MPIQYNQAVADAQAVSNFHKYPSGINKHNQKVNILSPIEFTNKYSDVFDNKTDPDKLPKTLEGLVATLMSKVAGANSAIKTTKLANNNLFNDKSLEEVFDIQKYSTTTTEEDENGKSSPITYYLQDEKQFYTFTKDIISFLKQTFDTALANKEEELKEEFNSLLNITTAELTADSSNKLEEAINSFRLEAPSINKNNNNLALASKTFNDYGVLVIEQNNSQNQVHSYLSTLPKEDLEKLYALWEKQVQDKFKKYLDADSSRQFSAPLIAQFTSNVLSELLLERGIVLTASLPLFNSNQTPVNPVQINKSSTIESSNSVPEVPNPFNPPRQALENNYNQQPNQSNNISISTKSVLQKALFGAAN